MFRVTAYSGRTHQEISATDYQTQEWAEHEVTWFWPMMNEIYAQQGVAQVYTRMEFIPR